MSLVVGYDDSPGARAALAVALELAGALGEPVHLAFAAAPPGRDVGDEYKAHRRALEEIGERVTGEALRRAGEAGVTAEAHVEAERPVDLLMRLADELEARAIVVGSYGESPLRGAVLGSTPHKLLHLSKRPVLAVPC
jgi:nucleotide-binding universal stress UspA family protein